MFTMKSDEIKQLANDINRVVALSTGELQVRYDDLLKQRDELLEACEAAVEYCFDGLGPDHRANVLKKLEQAIAHAEGKS